MVVRNHLFQIAVGRGHQSNIDLLCARAAQSLEFSFLQSTQKLGLEVEWDVAYLIKKQRAFVGEIEAADLL